MAAPTEAQLAEAYALGKQAAENAASWVAIGNTKPEFIPAVLKMFEDGDPAVDDYLPARPNLSGEWAGDPTPLTLAREITGDERLGITRQRDELIDALADEFERGVDENFMEACETELRKWLA